MWRCVSGAPGKFPSRAAISLTVVLGAPLLPGPLGFCTHLWRVRGRCATRAVSQRDPQPFGSRGKFEVAGKGRKLFVLRGQLGGLGAELFAASGRR